jgi:hypothetical protein
VANNRIAAVVQGKLGPGSNPKTAREVYGKLERLTVAI